MPTAVTQKSQVAREAAERPREYGKNASIAGMDHQRSIANNIFGQWRVKHAKRENQTMNNGDLHWELSPWRTGCIVAAVLTSLMVGNGLTIDIEDATTRIVEHARNVAMTGTWIALPSLPTLMRHLHPLELL